METQTDRDRQTHKGQSLHITHTERHTQTHIDRHGYRDRQRFRLMQSTVRGWEAPRG